MIEITFKEFYEYTYPNEECYELYVMKNGFGEVLYIGISAQNIWTRWFSSIGCHIEAGPNYLCGNSAVGTKIVDHLPDSWEWKLQLWTLEDCKEFCSAEINPDGRYTIKLMEPIMIKKLRPSLNVSMNLNPGKDSTPKSQREIEREKMLDQVYKEVFENRNKPKRRQGQ